MPEIRMMPVIFGAVLQRTAPTFWNNILKCRRNRLEHTAHDRFGAGDNFSIYLHSWQQGSLDVRVRSRNKGICRIAYFYMTDIA